MATAKCKQCGIICCTCAKCNPSTFVNGICPKCQKNANNQSNDVQGLPRPGKPVVPNR